MVMMVMTRKMKQRDKENKEYHNKCNNAKNNHNKDKNNIDNNNKNIKIIKHFAGGQGVIMDLFGY